MKIEQVMVGNMAVFCYLVYDEKSKEAILIDPAGNVDELLQLLEQRGLKLRYIVNTHGHPDHTCGNNRVREATAAQVVMHALDDDLFQRPEFAGWAGMLGVEAAGPADVRVQDGDELTFGNLTMKIIHTPGHTPGGCSILIDGNLFTGDTLFVGAVGRTDLPGASFEQLIHSLQTRVTALPPATVIWPGHDYGDRPHSTVEHEMKTNPYITDFMDE